jgi:3-oxoacyl-[acyl-carrier-protein] synthase II
MKAFINGIGLISPQKTTEPGVFLSEVVEHNAEYMKCLDPDYKAFIDPMAARRMSRLIKMGIVSAKICMADAGFLSIPPKESTEIRLPDAIITGTGLGSVEDTEKILNSISKGEQLLNPTPFIQSTYNTISSQIAISLKCHNYNSTYVHRTFSFESGLLDAMMQLNEKTADHVLVGGIDEMTMNHLNIIRRLGHFKMMPSPNLDLLKYQSPGAIAGEGSGYFLMSSVRSEKTYAGIAGIGFLYKPDGMEGIKNGITSFLTSLNLKIEDIDIFLTGLNGDKEFDSIYHQLSENLFPITPLAYFKNLCGEYHTASSFALWVAANCIRRQVYPEIIKVNSKVPDQIRNILIYNQYNRVNHSLILVCA